MEFLTKSGAYKTYEPDCTSLARLEVYRLSKDEIQEIEDQFMPTDAIMKFLGFENPRSSVEPGAWYFGRNFVAYNKTTGVLVIEVKKSFHI